MSKRTQLQFSTSWMTEHSLVVVFFDDLIYRNLQSDVVVARMAAVLIDPKLCSSHRLSIRDLSQIKAKLLVVSSLVRKIFIFLHWGRKYFIINLLTFIHTDILEATLALIQKLLQLLNPCMCCSKKKNMWTLRHSKRVIYHIFFYIPGPIQTFWLPTKALSSSLNQSTEYR